MSMLRDALKNWIYEYLYSPEKKSSSNKIKQEKNVTNLIK